VDTNSPFCAERIAVVYLASLLIFTVSSCNSPYLLQKIPLEALSYLDIEPTPDMLFRATAEGNLPKIKELLAAGVDINATTDMGYTPLHIAVLQGDLEIVSFLLKNGADPLIPTDGNETACTLAREKENQELLALIAAALVNKPKESITKKVVTVSRPTVIHPQGNELPSPIPKHAIYGLTIAPSNFRTKPTPFSTLIEVIPKGTKVLLYNEFTQGYVKISYQNKIGYIVAIDVDQKALKKVKR